MGNIKKILVNRDSSCQSIWFMRQAGRYLPEFRKIRSQNLDFIKLCLNSNLSSEITLQPIKRYNLDSAIIFSDILLVCYALGQDVNFVKNEGPILGDFNIRKFLETTEASFLKKIQPVYEAIKKTRLNLNKEKSLICFVGAPWTLLVYMLNLKKSDQSINISKIKNHQLDIDLIIKNLTKYLSLHIDEQIKAGADVVQIFDSWAGSLPNEELNKFCYKPNLNLVNFCKERNIPVICFPKGIKEKYLEFLNIVKPDGLNLDYDINISWAKENLTEVALQGGMHPLTLLKSNEKIQSEAKKYLDTFRNVPYIFNLGHGIVPKTDPGKLDMLIKFVRNYK